MLSRELRVTARCVHSQRGLYPPPPSRLNACRRDEYSVTISSQKLGMTVENVLERTVVRAAAPGGGAEAAGVETGSLLVALDGQSTKVRQRCVRN